MVRGLLVLAGVGAAWMLVAGPQARAWQDAASDPATPTEEVVIKRESIRVISAERYRVGLQLRPFKSANLVAPEDGVIRNLPFKVGDKVTREGEVFRLDNSRAVLVVKRAQALLAAAKAEKKIAETTNNPDQVTLADARLRAAESELEIANYDVGRLAVRSPLTGDLFRLTAGEGSYVRGGETIAVVGDTSRLSVTIPVDRSSTKAGEPIPIKVEDATVSANVEVVLPLEPQFEPLRDLADSLASAVVSIDNSGGKFHAGQAVYVPLIPFAPVVEVTTNSVSNLPSGGRKVQVLRESVVRNIAVQILARVGTDRVFVAGAFREGDELIVSSSRELADGQPLRPSAGLPADRSETASKTPAGGSTTTPKTPTKGTGF
jgi:biotin carboxyl carrier protein